MKKLCRKWAFISIILLLVALGTFELFLVNKVVHHPVSEPQKEKIQKLESHISLGVGDTFTELELLPGQTLLDVLKIAQEKNLVIFSGKNYPGLGFFVTDIGPLHTSNGKNLFYYVNGSEAKVGISSYKPKNGDIIIWKLK